MRSTLAARSFQLLKVQKSKIEVVAPDGTSISAAKVLLSMTVVRFDT